MQEEQAQLQSSSREGIPAPLPTLVVHSGTHQEQTGLTWNFQLHRSLQSSLGCHCTIPLKLKGISCLKPIRAFAFTGSASLEFLPLGAPKEEDRTSLVDLGLVREVWGCFFLNKTSKIRGVAASSLSFLSLQPFPWCSELPQAAAILDFLLASGLVHRPG